MSRSVSGSMAGSLAVLGFVMGLVAFQANVPGTITPMAFADDESSSSSSEDTSSIPAQSSSSSSEEESSESSESSFVSSMAPAAFGCSCGCTIGGGTGATAVAACITAPTPTNKCDTEYFLTKDADGNTITAKTDCKKLNGSFCKGYTGTGVLKFGQLYACYGPVVGASSSSGI